MSTVAIVQKISQKIKAIDKNLKVELLKSQDLEEYIKLEYVAHRSDKTSRVYHTVKKLLNSKPFVKGCFDPVVKNKTGFVIRENGLMIASITYLIKPGIVQSGLIASVAVHPKYQGRGISKILYKYVLKEMKSRGIKYFSGNTTTSKILSMSDDLGRVPNCIVLVKR